ncbi:DUF2231 domain-containing protein [Chroococcidiopsis sp.]|uniref:DUF2231 domain-containing protein n=1 Tax=Chroococcidiopsis sp. TaxID=3088168 RepID=UPI003F3EE165
MDTQQKTGTPPYPDIPALIENDEREYHDPGIPSTVAVLGHPIHPLLVTLPIAFLLALAVTDAVYWLNKDPFWARASFWLVVAGFATTLPAALTGLMDFLRIDRVRKRTAGLAHLVLNITIIVLTGINLLLRLNNVVGAILPTGLTLSLITATLLGLSGWYGAELIYRHKIAVIGNSSRSEP